MKVGLSWFTVENLEEAKKFYGEILGLKKTFEMPHWVEFSHADGEHSIGLMEQPKAQGDAGATIVLEVESLDAEKKRLVKSGVEFISEDEVPGVVRLAKFRDSSGNPLQLMQNLMK